jgi:hypothetical protein
MSAPKSPRPAAALAPAQRERLDPGLLDSLNQQEADAAVRISVIVEARMPDTGRVTIQSRPDGLSSRPAVVDSDACAVDPGTALQAIQRLVCSMELEAQPVVLERGHALVVSLRPDQLLAVAELPEVGIIRPNRSHRV